MILLFDPTEAKKKLSQVSFMLLFDTASVYSKLSGVYLFLILGKWDKQ